MIGERVSTSISKPEAFVNPEFERARKKDDPRSDLPDFAKLIQTSNEEKQLEIKNENEKNNMKDGELLVGESKDDKEFRTMLEKITGKKQDPLKNKLEKDDYLNLMVTQLKYQDPTKPIENQEMATQLAQFNTVEQLLGINKLLTEMSQAQKNQATDKYPMILGKTIQVEGNKISLSGQKANQCSFQLPALAGNVSVEIKNSSGSTVRTLTLGRLEKGDHQLNWDFKDDLGQPMSDGNYQFHVMATTADGKPIEAKTFLLGKVDRVVNLKEGGALETSFGTYSFDDVVSIRNS